MKLSEYAKKNSITYRTAFRHWQKGLINGKQLETGTIVVFDEKEIKCVDYYIYCRVSSYDQKEDLKRQEVRLKDFCSAKGFVISGIYSEIASGLNDTRPKLNKLLKLNCHIVVEHKDRLTRFGFNYIKILMNNQGRELIVINETESKSEIIQDFISIIISFCARIYGKRRSKRASNFLIEDLKNENSKK